MTENQIQTDYEEASRRLVRAAHQLRLGREASRRLVRAAQCIEVGGSIHQAALIKEARRNLDIVEAITQGRYRA